MRSDMSSQSQSSQTQGELLQEQENIFNIHQQVNRGADLDKSQEDHHKLDDLNQENLQLKIKQASKDSDSTSPDSDYLNFDTGDSEEKQFSKFFLAIRILGSGAFGKVVQARDIKTGQEYAVKVIAKNNVSQGEIDRLRKEARILSQLDHKNIVKFDRVFESETRIFIVMELLLGGTLRQLMSEKKKSKDWFTEYQASIIMNNIISGVQFFHGKGIVHRDLKPENILIGDKNDLSTVKIADFGLSAAFEAKKSISLTQQCGTLIYMAPEFFVQKIYSKPIDIWSCAIMMYQLLSNGVHPLYDPKFDDNKSFKKKIKASPQIKFPPTFSEITKTLILKMTLLDPQSRYTVNQVIQHPWITQKLEDAIPLTMNEMLQSFNKQSNFSNMKSTNKNNNNPSIVCSNQYKEKCKKFSQKKKKDSKVIQKVDIYSQNYLNSIMDLDQTKRISSFISDDSSENDKYQSQEDEKSQSEEDTNQYNNTSEIKNLKLRTFIKLSSDNASSVQDNSSPYQRGSLASTTKHIQASSALNHQIQNNQIQTAQNIQTQNNLATSTTTSQNNQASNFIKSDQILLKSTSPLLKKYQQRKQFSASVHKKAENQQNGNGNEINPFQININGINQLSINQSSNTLQAIPMEKQASQKVTHVNRRSISLHKTNTQQHLDSKSNELNINQNQNATNQESYHKLEKDYIIEKTQPKNEKFTKKISFDSKEQEGNSPGFNIKVFNREELNNQISKKERIHTQNSVTIDQQRSVSPRKKNSHLIIMKRDNSRRGQEVSQNQGGGASLSPVKVASSASPYKNYNLLKRASRNPSMMDEIENNNNINSQQNQTSANSTLCNTINTQRTYTMQSVVLAQSTISTTQNQIQESSPDQYSQRRTSQLKNYAEIPEHQKIIHLQKAQTNVKTQYPQSNSQQIYGNQPSQMNQYHNQYATNSTYRAISDKIQGKSKNQSPPQYNNNGQPSIITSSVNNQIQNFAKLSSTQQQQPVNDSLPIIQKGLHQIVSKPNNQSTIRERQSRAISQDQKSNQKGLSFYQQNLNQSIIIQDNNNNNNYNNNNNNNKQSSLTSTTIQHSLNQIPLKENSTKIHIIKDIDSLNANNTKRMIQNINSHKITINQRPLTKK